MRQFDRVFMMVADGQKEMEDVEEKFRFIQDAHPFRLTFRGTAPYELHMNPSVRVLFFEHQDGLDNRSAGIKEYLQGLLLGCGVPLPVRRLNS